MKSRNYRLAARFILVTGMAVSGCLQAQQVSGQDVDSQESASEQQQAEATSNLRESVHENLDTLIEDAEKIDELEQQAQPPADTQEETAAPRDVVGGTAPSSEDHAFDRYLILNEVRSLPRKLQTLPEKLPLLRGRGLIFFGRAEADYAHYTRGITSEDSGFRVRSLRAGLAKAFKHNLSAKVEIDLTDGESSWSDLYVRYHHEKWGLLTAGNQRVAQTLVTQTSRISQTFMEDPLPAEAFGLDRRLGLGWDLHKPKAGMHLTVFGPDLNAEIGDRGFGGRVYFNPRRTRFSLFHLGISLVAEKMSRKTRFYSRPESHVTDKRLVDTGIYQDVDHQSIAAFEMAGSKGPFMFRGEYYRATWGRNSGKDPVFRGFYAQSSWVLTGESFNYSHGKFIRLRPQNPRGAWEVAVRYSYLDLDDSGITGGKERNVTVGLNWYAPGGQLRLMSNLIFVSTGDIADDEDPTIFQLRAQLHW